MVSSPDSPKLNALIVTESGIQRDDGRPYRGKIRKQPLVLSRALMRYHFLPQPAGVSRGQADRSAALYAEAHNPFPQGRYILIRAVRGYSLWWWDFAAVDGIVGRTVDTVGAAFVPESALFEIGDGWRQLRTREGFEAQYWRDLTLVASTWRRRPFSVHNWAAFVGGIDQPAEAPGEPPTVVVPKLSGRGLKGLPLVQQREVWPLVQSATLSVAALFCCLAAWFMGQTFRWGQIEEQSRAELAAEAGTVGSVAPNALTRPDLVTLTSIVADYDRPSPLIVSAAVLEIAAKIGELPVKWEVEEGRVKLEFQAADRGTLEEMAASLERHPWLSDVRPQLDPATGAAFFLATVCESLRAAECGADGGDSAAGKSP
jgi:hypothetical protein